MQQAAAQIAARLARRPGAVDFDSEPTAFEIAEARGGAEFDYALTGDAGASLYRPSAGEAWPDRVDGVAVAASDQVIRDVYGGIDRMAEKADILVGRSSP